MSVCVSVHASVCVCVCVSKGSSTMSQAYLHTKPETSMKKIKSENHLMGNGLGGNVSDGGGGGGLIKSGEHLDSENAYLSPENSLKVFDHGELVERMEYI